MAPLLFGETKQSPREAHYYFSGNRLEAVRAGPWKLAIAAQSEGRGQPKNATPPPDAPFKPKLYNLDRDIGETTDVVGEHPEVVSRLQALAAKMHADLGMTKPGPGVRPPGRVAKPQPLLLKPS